MRAPFWRSVDRIMLDCNVADGVAPLLARDFCAQAMVEARRGAAMAVVPLDRGTPRPTDAVLSVRFEGVLGKPVIVARLARALSIDESEGVRQPPPFEVADGALLATLSDAFDRLLPWRRSGRHDLVRAPSPPRSDQFEAVHKGNE